MIVACGQVVRPQSPTDAINLTEWCQCGVNAPLGAEDAELAWNPFGARPEVASFARRLTDLCFGQRGQGRADIT